MPIDSVDLHCHSTASDGTLAPEEVVRLAKRNGLSALALTDHDTVAGIPAASAEAATLGIDFLPGIEISCEYPRPGTMHLLGYGIDPSSPTLADLTRTLVQGRDARNLQIVRKLNEIGIAVSIREVEDIAGGDVIGRPHFAEALVRRGIVSHTAEAFKMYLGQGGRVYVDKEQLTAKRAIEMIRESGGLPVLAHPSQLRKENNAQLENTIKELIDYGLAGIEVIHSDHRDSFIDDLCDMADRFKVLKTGGSDFHGGNKPHIELGKASNRRIPREYFDELVDHIHRSVKSEKKAG
jgi:predicted metal-dependent phosphoesterase TrpH